MKQRAKEKLITATLVSGDRRESIDLRSKDFLAPRTVYE